MKYERVFLNAVTIFLLAISLVVAILVIIQKKAEAKIVTLYTTELQYKNKEVRGVILRRKEEIYDALGKQPDIDYKIAASIIKSNFPQYPEGEYHYMDTVGHISIAPNAYLRDRTFIPCREYRVMIHKTGDAKYLGESI